MKGLPKNLCCLARTFVSVYVNDYILLLLLSFPLPFSQLEQSDKALR